MRKLIAGMKVSADMKAEGPEGMADWVDAWSEDYGLGDRIDACLLGGGMYPGYERYWSGLQAAPDTPAWITGAPPTAAELRWADVIRRTPHYVLSHGLAETAWPVTRFIRTLDEVADLKRQPGRDIYPVGGPRTTAGLIDAGLVDELRLIVHPLIAGPGTALFATTARRTALALQSVETLEAGRIRLVYGVG